MLTMRGPKGPRRGLALNELGIIPDGALLIRDGELLEVGTTRRVENLAEARNDARLITRAMGELLKVAPGAGATGAARTAERRPSSCVLATGVALMTGRSAAKSP